MATIAEIRISNLNQLISEYGSIRALAEAIDRAPSVISQMKNGRSFGEKIARHIEKSLNLPIGYLDSEHPINEKPLDEILEQIKSMFASQQLTIEEQQLLGVYRKLPVSKRKLVINLLAELDERNS